MRKAMQGGMWLVVMASVFVASPALAQEGPPAEAPGRVESDPRLAAASEAWHDAWRTNVEAHLRAVAARGTPRDLLAAGWLWPIEDDVGRAQMADSLFRAQAGAWIRQAYDASRGDDALVDWALLDACETMHASCDRGVLLQRLMTRDPGNAEILLTAYHDAVERRDTAAAERYWQAASQGTHYHPRINELGVLMASVLRQTPTPALDPALAEAMGQDLDLGRPATPRDMADMAVLALNAAIAMPTLRHVTQRCTAQVGQLPADARATCKRVYALLAADESTLMGPLVALPRLVEWADTDAERAATRERLRRILWVYDNVMQQYQRPVKERHMPADYIDRLFRDGEVAAMRYQLQVNGILLEPPATWLPDNPEHHALLTGNPAATR